MRATPEHLIVANIRHKTALTQVRDNLSNALKGLEEGTSLEFIAFEIRSALDALGEMVGETSQREEVFKSNLRTILHREIDVSRETIIPPYPPHQSLDH